MVGVSKHVPKLSNLFLFWYNKLGDCEFIYQYFGFAIQITTVKFHNIRLIIFNKDSQNER